jgi:hypothetical protein
MNYFGLRVLLLLISSRRGTAMKDMHQQLEKLIAQASECAAIAGSATDSKKRELFERLAAHFEVLAAEVKRAIAQAKSGSD